MSEENPPESPESQPEAEQAPPAPAAPEGGASEAEAAAEAFDMRGRRDFGALTLVLAIAVLLGVALLVFSGKFGKFGGKLPEGVIARVGSQEFPLEDFNSWVRSLPPSVQIQAGKPEVRGTLLARYLDRISMLVYAKERGVYETQSYAEEEERQRSALAVRLMLEDVLRDTMIPESLKSFYTENRKRYPRPFDDRGQRQRLIQDYQRKVIVGMADSLLEGVTVQLSDDPADPVLAQLVFSAAESTPITREEFRNELAQHSEADQWRAATEEGRQEFLKRMERQQVLARAARRRGYYDRPELEALLAELRPHMVALTLAHDELGDLETAVSAEIEQNRSAYEREAMHGAHILLRLAPTAKPAQVEEVKSRAWKIYKEITAPGGDFAALARKYSEDPGSAEKGGDLGVVRRDQLVKPFADAAFALTEGQVSEPVQSLFGFHVIKALGNPEKLFDETAARLMARRALVEQAMSRRVERIRQDLGVVTNEAALAAWEPPQVGRPGQGDWPVLSPAPPAGQGQ